MVNFTFCVFLNTLKHISKIKGGKKELPLSSPPKLHTACSTQATHHVSHRPHSQASVYPYSPPPSFGPPWPLPSLQQSFLEPSHLCLLIPSHRSKTQESPQCSAHHRRRPGYNSMTEPLPSMYSLCSVACAEKQEMLNYSHSCYLECVLPSQVRVILLFLGPIRKYSRAQGSKDIAVGRVFIAKYNEWPLTVTPAPKRLRQKDCHELQTRLGPGEVSQLGPMIGILRPWV